MLFLDEKGIGSGPGVRRVRDDAIPDRTIDKEDKQSRHFFVYRELPLHESFIIEGVEDLNGLNEDSNLESIGVTPYKESKNL